MSTSFTFDSFAASHRALIEEVKKRVKASRFTHTLAVARESVFMANAFALSESDAKRLFVAAILHDVTKSLTEKEHICLARELGISLSEDDLASPPTLHALTGAAVAERDFAPFTDPIVCKAIASHTVGGDRMTLVDKLLFLADYIEETRKHPICIQTREAFHQALLSDEDKNTLLDRFVLSVCQSTVDYLIKDGRPIHPQTEKTIESLIKKH